MRRNRAATDSFHSNAGTKLPERSLTRRADAAVRHVSNDDQPRLGRYAVLSRMRPGPPSDGSHDTVLHDKLRSLASRK